jgi:hypothetical protein
MLNLRSANPADINFMMATERLPDYVPILGQWEVQGNQGQAGQLENASC